jgi:hypothetical protein
LPLGNTLENTGTRITYPGHEFGCKVVTAILDLKKEVESKYRKMTSKVL